MVFLILKKILTPSAKHCHRSRVKVRRRPIVSHEETFSYENNVVYINESMLFANASGVKSYGWIR